MGGFSVSTGSTGSTGSPGAALDTPGRARLAGVIGLAVLAPVLAELTQAYLGDLGGPLGVLFLVAFLAPLYGGAALLVREISVRTGRGWPGRLLLAAAFGVAMTTLIDLSLFTAHAPDIDGWDDIVSAATIGGISVYAIVTWVGGHVLMSVGATLGVVESLVRRPGPWLRRLGIAVVVVLMVAVAIAIHHDNAGSYDVHPTTVQYAVSVGIVLALVGLALTPLGRPVRRTSRETVGPRVCAVTGFLLMSLYDLVPISWLGVGLELVALALGGWLVLRWSRSSRWRQRQVAALVFGAVLARTLLGFLAPLPSGTSWAEKLSQNVAYLVLVLGLGAAMAWRTRADEPSSR